MNDKNGTIDIDGYRVWYRQVGSGSIPLLTLHGGPGLSHDYLEPLEALAADRPVIFYDQLGCGRSDQPDDQSLWQIERFVSEVSTVRDALGLEQIHLLGHSWGGWLAIEYMLTQPNGVVSLVLASTSASTPEFIAGATRLKTELPQDIYDTLERYEASGELHHPDYQAAVAEFYQRHLCRLDPMPDAFLRSIANLEGNGGVVYETMFGPNEFTATGNLKDWDRTDRLSEISVPTLITVGRYDEMTPACAETMVQGIPNAKMHIFEQSSHSAHVEETEAYLQVLSDFLAGVEKE